MSPQMKAIVFTRYGSPDDLELLDVPKPVPRQDEVLVKVHAVSLNDWDWGALQGEPFVNRWIFGLLKPKRQILGSDISGRVEAVGSEVTAFRPGVDVFGDLSGEWGGFAEYACARESALCLKPPDMAFEQAAAIPQAGLLALQGLRDKGRIRTGQKVLINGAGGGVGTFAVQIARTYDVEITAVDAPEKLDMLRSMGVEHVVDYTREDFTRSGRRYDLILDVKTNRSVFAYLRVLSPDGAYITLGGSMPRLLQALLLGPLISATSRRKVGVVALRLNEGLEDMKALFAAGSVVPVIDRIYALRDVPEAFRRFAKARQKGKIVIVVDGARSGAAAR